MLKLREQAEAILEQLGTIAAFNQVAILENIDIDELRRPGILPMVQLLLSADPTVVNGWLESSRTSWTVLITAKSMTGAAGLMALVDAVLDSLTGFVPIVGTRPLSPQKIEFVDRGGEAPAYAVTLSTVQDARPP